jgi:hypothetical protein
MEPKFRFSTENGYVIARLAEDPQSEFGVGYISGRHFPHYQYAKARLIEDWLPEGMPSEDVLTLKREFSHNFSSKCKD